MTGTRWLTVQEVDARNRAKRAAAREALPRLLAEASRGKPWRYVLFGSLARGNFHATSDADIAILDAGEHWPEAERAVFAVADAVGIRPDISYWEHLSPEFQAEVERHGIRCG